jgi:hypothetical protein
VLYCQNSSLCFKEKKKRWKYISGKSLAFFCCCCYFFPWKMVIYTCNSSTHSGGWGRRIPSSRPVCY